MKNKGIKFLATVTVVLAVLFCITAVLYSDAGIEATTGQGTEDDPYIVTTSGELVACIDGGESFVKMNADITLEGNLSITHTTTLDLNGHILNVAGYQIAIPNDGCNSVLTVNDSNSEAVHNGYIDANMVWTVADPGSGIATTINGGIILKGQLMNYPNSGNNSGFILNGGTLAGYSAESHNAGWENNGKWAAIYQQVGKLELNGMDVKYNYNNVVQEKFSHGAIIASMIQSSGSFTINESHIDYNKASLGIIRVNKNAQMNSGSVSHNVVTGGDGTVESCCGTIDVGYRYSKNASFTLNGGNIDYNESKMAGGFCLIEEATLTVGSNNIANEKISISHNHVSGYTGDKFGGAAVYLRESSTFNFYSGTISYNESAQNGGAVQVMIATFNMYGGIIDHCYACSNGGAVYNNNPDACFYLSGGSISNCISGYNNGEAYTGKYGNGGAVWTQGTFEMSGGKISSCKANGTNDTKTGSGGPGGDAVYIRQGEFTLTNGIIENAASPNHTVMIRVNGGNSTTFSYEGGSIDLTEVSAWIRNWSAQGETGAIVFNVNVSNVAVLEIPIRTVGAESTTTTYCTATITKTSGDLVLDQSAIINNALTIPNNVNLVIGDKVSLTNNGIITNNGAMEIYGAIVGNGTISGTGLAKAAVAVPSVSGATVTPIGGGLFAVGEEITRTGEGALTPIDGLTIAVDQGYEFGGWTITKASDGSAYEGNTVPTYGIVMTPQVTKPTNYTVKFTIDGNLYASYSVEPGKAVMKPEDPYMEGYKFTGWLYNGAKWNFSNPVTRNMELIAEWSNDMYVTVPESNDQFTVSNVTPGPEYAYDSEFSFTLANGEGYLISEVYAGTVNITDQGTEVGGDYTFTVKGDTAVKIIVTKGTTTTETSKTKVDNDDSSQTVIDTSVVKTAGEATKINETAVTTKAGEADKTTKVEATVSETAATVDFTAVAGNTAVVSESLVAAIIDNVALGDEVKMEIAAATSTVDIPKAAMTSDEISDITVTVNGGSANAATITLPAGFLDAANIGQTVSVSVTDSPKQADAAAAGATAATAAFDLNLVGTATTEFEQDVTVSMDVSLPAGATNVKFYCLDNGTTVPATYANGTATGALPHFSAWAIVYDLPADADVFDDDELPPTWHYVPQQQASTSHTTMIVAACAAAVAAIAVALVMLNVVRKN